MKFPLRSLSLTIALLLVRLAATPQPCRAADASAAQRPADVPADAKVLLDLPYVENGSKAQRLDLYVPAEPKGPLLVWIHGGGWVGGTKSNAPGLAMLKEGVAVASVEYRFSNEAIFPAQIEDCKAALRWLRAHAKEYGYGRDQVAAWGASAGGHLTALLAVTGQVKDFDVGANLEQSSAIRCGVDLFGPAEFGAYDPKLPTAMVQRENPDSVIAKLFGGPVSKHLELAKRASPVTWVTKDAAPLLILQGTKDPLVPLDQSQRLYDKLKAAGAEVAIKVFEGAGHGGPDFQKPETLQLIHDFLVQHWGK